MLLNKSTYAPTFGPSNNTYRNLSYSYTSNNTKVYGIRLFTTSLVVQLTLDQHEGQGTHSLCSQKFTYNFTVSLLYPRFASADSTNLDLMVLQCRRPQLDSWVGKIPWRRDMLPTPVFLGFLGGLDGKRICLQCRRPGFNPGVGKIPWRRAWQPTPVFSPGEFHGQESLEGYCPWGHSPWGRSPRGRRESGTTERLSTAQHTTVVHIW